MRRVKISIVLLSICLFSSGCLKAPIQKKEVKESSDFVVSPKAYRHLNKASEFVEKKEYDKALEEMERMKRREIFNDHERALMWQQFAGIWAIKGDYKKAAICMEKVLELNALLEQAMLDTQYHLGELYLALSQYLKAAKLLAAWIERVKEPELKTYYLVATAYSQADRFAQALPYAQKAVNGMKEQKKEWLQLLLSIYYELKQTDKLLELLKRMIESYPEDKKYWMQLSALYANMEKNEEALAVLELAYAQGMLTQESELTNLANLYMMQGLAIKTVQLIDKELKAERLSKTPEVLEIYANALLLAREDERALSVLAQSAEESNNGKFYLQMARIYIDKQKWRDARVVLEKAVKKAGFDSPGKAYLLLGIASYNSNRKDAALAAFDKAKQDEATRSSAEHWIGILQKKQSH